MPACKRARRLPVLPALPGQVKGCHEADICRPVEECRAHKLRRGRWHPVLLRVTAHAGEGRAAWRACRLRRGPRSQEAGCWPWVPWQCLPARSPAARHDLRLACTSGTPCACLLPACACRGPTTPRPLPPPFAVERIDTSNGLVKWRLEYRHMASPAGEHSRGLPACTRQPAAHLHQASVHVAPRLARILMRAWPGPQPVQPAFWRPARANQPARPPLRCLARQAARRASTAAPLGRRC